MQFLIDCVLVKWHINPCRSFCVVSQRKGEDSRGDEREEQGRKRKTDKSEETEEIKISPPPPPPLLLLATARLTGLPQLLANISWTPRWSKIHNTRLAGLPQILANISWMPRWSKIHDTFASLNNTPSSIQLTSTLLTYFASNWQLPFLNQLDVAQKDKYQHSLVENCPIPS